jgi:hypothetical protein
MLIISERELIDEKGFALMTNKKRNVSPRFNNALVQNVAYGNTQLLNPSLRDLVLSHGAGAKYFDSWVYLIACAYGEVKRVDKKLVSYRIHGSNAIGMGKKSIKNLIEILIDSRDQCFLFSKVFKNADEEKKVLMEVYLKVFHSRWFFQRFYFSLMCRISRQSKVETIIWKLSAPFIGRLQNSKKYEKS